MDEKNEKGFTVKDKRIISEDDASRDQPKIEHSAHTADQESPPLPEINFASFIISLSSSALFHFGEIPDPVTETKQRNLPLAKQTIDILGILKNKTAGNLTKDEGQLLENLLYDLRVRYVEEMKKEKTL
ncbi:MAG: DUF1844 domain-containing protein [Pseudomonadota bacterium]